MEKQAETNVAKSDQRKKGTNYRVAVYRNADEINEPEISSSNTRSSSIEKASGHFWGGGTPRFSRKKKSTGCGGGGKG